jgi:hypothetical protein
MDQKDTFLNSKEKEFKRNYKQKDIHGWEARRRVKPTGLGYGRLREK